VSARSLNGLNGRRPFFAIAGALVALALPVGFACGSSPTSAAPDASVDASADAGTGPGISVVQVVTQGGGADAAGSNPFGGPAPTASSNDSAPPEDGGPASDDGGPTPDGASDGASDAPSYGPPDACGGYAPVMCNGAPCDLRANTCCITFSLQERCLPGANATCNSNEAAVHCSQACDCPTGESCCGVIDTLVGSVQTGCQFLSPSQSGGNCQPYPLTVSQASGQLCAESSECQNGQPCISQTCIYGAMLNICGLQSQSPYDCTANDN